MYEVDATSLMEIVGGSLHGYWLGITENHLLLVEVEQDPSLIDARIELAGWEKRPLVLMDQNSGGLAVTLGAAFRRSNKISAARKRLADLESRPVSRTVVATLPFGECLAQVAEEETSVIRKSSSEDYEVDLRSDKWVAEELSWRWDLAVVAGTRDSLYDDVRELPDNIEKCLLIQFIDGNTAVVADYTSEILARLKDSCLHFDKEDFELTSLILRNPSEALEALAEDSALLEMEDRTEFRTAIERLRYKQDLAQRQQKHTKLMIFGELVLRGDLSFDHCRIRKNKLKCLSLSVSPTYDSKMERVEINGRASEASIQNQVTRLSDSHPFAESHSFEEGGTKATEEANIFQWFLDLGIAGKAAVIVAVIMLLMFIF
jgi:hypothetical protein